MFVRFTLVLVTLIALAQAHVSMNPGTIPPDGGYFKSAFRLPHGCSASETSEVHYPTMKFQIQIPQVVANASTVRPEMVANWSINITDNADGSRTLLWTAASPADYISDDYFMEFGVNMKVPAGVAGSTLLFPSTQFCTNNTQAAWVELTEDAEMPAPSLVYQDDCTCDGSSSSTANSTIQPLDTTDTPTTNASGATHSAMLNACFLMVLFAALSVTGGL